MTDRALGCWIGILTAVQLAVLWLLPYPVGTDLPTHLATLAVLSDPHGLGFGRFFDCAWFQSPYLVANALTLLFSTVADWPTAAKLTLSLYLAALPLAALYWLRSFPGSSARNALFASALAVNSALLGGSLQILHALPATLVVLGGWFRSVEEDSWKRRGLLCLGMLFLYFQHFVALVWTACVLGASALGHPGRRRLLADLILSLAAPALAFALFLQDLGSFPSIAQEFRWTWPEALFHRLASPFVGFSLAGDLATLTPLLAVYLALAAKGIRAAGCFHPLVPALGAGAALTLLAPPTGVWQLAGCRLALLSFFLALPILAAPGRLAFALAAAGALAWNGYFAVHLVQTQKAVVGYVGVLDRIPPGQAVFPLFETTELAKGGSRAHSLLASLVGYYHVRAGGASPILFDRARSPWEGYLRYKDERMKSESFLLGDFDVVRYAPRYPYIVYKGSAAGLTRLVRYRVLVSAFDVSLLERIDR